MKYKQTEKNRHVEAECPKCKETNNYRDGSDYNYAICNGCNYFFPLPEKKGGE